MREATRAFYFLQRQRRSGGIDVRRTICRFNELAGQRIRRWVSLSR